MKVFSQIRSFSNRKDHSILFSLISFPIQAVISLHSQSGEGGIWGIWSLLDKSPRKIDQGRRPSIHLYDPVCWVCQTGQQKSYPIPPHLLACRNVRTEVSRNAVIRSPNYQKTMITKNAFFTSGRRLDLPHKGGKLGQLTNKMRRMKKEKYKDPQET